MINALVVLVLYFLPSLIAHFRHHRSENSVTVVNLFLGWTFIGWIVALAIALNSNVKNPVDLK